MKKNLETQKEKIKGSLSKIIDTHFEEFEKRSSQSEFTIDDMEELMLKQQKNIRDILNESNSDLVSSIEIDSKKNCPKCGNTIRRTKKGEKVEIKTLNGELEIIRDYYYCRKCQYSETPLDEFLEIDELPHKMTKGLMLEVAYYGQNQNSFSDASEMLERALHMEVNKETVRAVTERIGRMVFEADTKKAVHVLENMHEIEVEPEENRKGVLYIMTDGAAVNTRVKDENGSSWRENKTVIAFTDKDMIKRKDGSHMIIKKEYAAFIGSAEEFRGYVLNTAVNAGYGKIREVVIIGDGAAWIRNMAAELFPESVQILDLYHLKENIYTYAKYKFAYNDKEYAAWAEIFIDKIEKGKKEEALQLLPEEEKLPAGVVNLRTYINNNIDRINYHQYKKMGYFVGSGAIESANKVILQRRLKQSGMRWSAAGAQDVLSLRAKVESARWESDVESLLLA